MRNYSAKLILSFVALILGFWIASCKKENENVLIDQLPPIVETNKITDSTEYTAKGGGTITAAGGSPILRRGLVWGLTDDLDTSLTTKAISGSGRGVFLVDLKGLAPGTKYYVVAFAVNEIGMAFGEIKSFTTLPLPDGYAVMGPTDEATEITANSATCGGSIISEGKKPILFRGVCWSTTSGPTVALNTKTQKDTGANFISKIKGLIPLTQYFVRSYVTNSAGTSYGNEISFTTPENPNGGNVKDFEGNSYRITKIGTQTWMAENLKAAKYQNGDSIIKYSSNKNFKNNSTKVGGFAEGNQLNKFGNYYNFYAIVDPRNLCPKDWHVPSQDEWKILSNTIGGDLVAGGKLKSGSGLWTNSQNAENVGANDSTFFSGLPAGQISSSSDLPTLSPTSLGTGAFFWSKSISDETFAYGLNLTLTDAKVKYEQPINKKSGYSVRCLKD